MPLISLYRIKIISDALNLILPSASLSGDAVRAFLIKKDVPLHEGIPGVLFDKTVSRIAFIYRRDFLATAASLFILLGGAYVFMWILSVLLPMMTV